MSLEYDGRTDGFELDAEAQRDRLSEKKKKYRRRKIIRRRIIASIIAVMILALILFVISLFIRVKEITITGTFGSYTYDQVLEASGLEQGDRLLYLSPETIENEIEKELPYMVNVEVKRRLFSKVIIEVDYASEAYCLYTSGKYVVVNSDFKALRFEENSEQIDMIKIIGLDCSNVKLGETLALDEDARTGYFEKLYNGLQGEPFDELDYIDVTDSLGLKVGFKNGLEIKFGNYTNLDYNLGWAASVVRELQNKHDVVDGTLDLSIFKKAYYTPRSGDAEPALISTYGN